MATPKPHVVRQRVAAAISGTLGSTWRQAVIVEDDLVEGRSTRHKTFDVSVPESTFVDPRRRARGGATEAEPGIRTDTTVVVRWFWNLRPDGHAADYDAALEIEPDVVAAVLGVDADGLGPPVVQDLRRDIVAALERGPVLLETRLRVVFKHLYPGRGDAPDVPVTPDPVPSDWYVLNLSGAVQRQAGDLASVTQDGDGWWTVTMNLNPVFGAFPIADNQTAQWDRDFVDATGSVVAPDDVGRAVDTFVEVDESNTDLGMGIAVGVSDRAAALLSTGNHRYVQVERTLGGVWAQSSWAPSQSFSAMGVHRAAIGRSISGASGFSTMAVDSSRNAVDPTSSRTRAWPSSVARFGLIVTCVATGSGTRRIRFRPQARITSEPVAPAA